MSADELAIWQLERWRALIAKILPENAFYARKFAGSPLPLDSLQRLADLSTTTKDELIDQSPDGLCGAGSRAANHTWPVERDRRFHQTSGTRGRPLVVMDTADDWQWWVQSWQYVLDAAEITPADRAFLAFSFGPFIGFWSAHDALAARGTMVIPGGGLKSAARLALLAASRATVLLATPSYALRLAEVARDEKFDLSSLAVRRIIVAGEPGGSLPAVRDALRQAFSADIIDHAGATEVGPWGFGDIAGTGLYVNEAEFIAERLRPGTDVAAADGELAELVLTNLGRFGAPVIRYRTGDLVRAERPTAGPCRFLFLRGGILGRIDEMLVIRGVNIFPTAVEQIVREFPEVAAQAIRHIDTGARQAA